MVGGAWWVVSGEWLVVGGELIKWVAVMVVAAVVWCVAGTGQNPLQPAGRSSGTKWVLWQADGDTWCGVWLRKPARTH